MKNQLIEEEYSDRFIAKLKFVELFFLSYINKDFTLPIWVFFILATSGLYYGNHGNLFTK